MSKVVRDVRNKILGGLADRVREIYDVVSKLDDKITESEKANQKTQLDINHEQLMVLEEIEKRVKNSGTIALSDTEIITKIFSGLKMYLDPRDMAITPHLALDGIWEHRITMAWLAVVGPTDTVIEIGSNNGYYGALAAQLSDKKHSKVIMFEANPNLIPYIRKTLAVNWLNEQTVLENMAVSDKDGEVTLHVLKDYIGSSSIHDNKDVEKYMGKKMYLETAQDIKVKSTSIDSYCKKHSVGPVDLFLMDIEGYEDIAYRGMRGTVQASPNATLFIEFTPQGYKEPKAFYDTLLKDFGHVYIIDDKGYIVKPKSTDHKTIIGEADDWVMPIFSKNPKLANR
jgi:FkbM family methyltransferase